GKDSDGRLVYEIRLTPSTGKWEFYQYQGMNKTGDGQIDFNYLISDADGDGVPGSVAVAVQSAPTITFGENGVEAGDLSVQEQGAAVEGSFTVTSSGSGLGLTIEDTSSGVRTTVDLAGLEAGHPQTITMDNGSVMVLTGYDPASGTVTYTDQSNQARQHTGNDDNV